MAGCPCWGRSSRLQPPSAATATATVSTARDFRNIATTLAPANSITFARLRIVLKAGIDQEPGFRRGPRTPGVGLRDDEVGDRPHAFRVGVQRRGPAR